MVTADEVERQELRDRVVVMHLDAAESVAWRYAGRGQDHQELVQVARLALVEAVRRFDPGRGPFLAYAFPTMVGHVKRHFRDHGWMVRPPRAIQERRAGITAARDQLSQSLGRHPDPVDIAHHLQLSQGAVIEAENIGGCYQPTSLDAAFLDQGETNVAPDLYSVLSQQEPDLDRVDVLATIRTACLQLSDDDKQLLYLRFFTQLSQLEIAAEIGGSQMQISRRLSRLLQQLRQTIGDLEPPPAQSC